jgi:hypothetical protein
VTALNLQVYCSRLPFVLHLVGIFNLRAIACCSAHHTAVAKYVVFMVLQHPSRANDLIFLSGCTAAAQTESMLLQVQVFISEYTRGGNGPAAASAANGRSDRSSSHDQRQQRSQQPHNQQHQQHNRVHSQQQHNQQQHHARHSQQHHSSSQQQQPRGMGGSEGLRHRQQQQQKPVQEDPSVTPEQRQVVQQILAAKGFYDVLGVPKDAAESDIKQAYRKVGGQFSLE